MPRTPRTPKPGLPADLATLAADPTEGDDGAIHHFWEWLIARRLVAPDPADAPAWADLFARFDRGE